MTNRTHRIKFRALLDAEDSDNKGYLRARVCELDAIDKIELIIARGGLIEPRRPAVISAWSHSAVGFAAAMHPVGKGFVFEEGNFLIAEGQYDMEMQAARDAWRAVQMLRETVEFSILLHILEEEWQERDGDYFPVVTQYDVSEWSPCIRGVSFNTGVDELRANNEQHQDVQLPRQRMLQRRYTELRLRALEHQPIQGAEHE